MPKDRKKAKRCVLSLLLVFSLLFPFSVSIGAVPTFPDTSGAETVYLWNREHDKVIYSKNDKELLYPASLTKIMTGLVAIDLIGDRLDESVTLTSDMLADRHGTSMQLRVGETLTYKDLLYGAICGGFNDATTALAVASAKSMSAFIEKMNEKAKQLGARDTHFTNPTGWYDENMVSTLHDLTLIAKEAAKNELYLTVSSETSYTVPKTNKNESFTVHNRNGLIGSFYAIGYHNKRAKGLIAGNTDEGGYCLATTFEYDGLSYLLIVMGGYEKNGNIPSYSIANDIISHTINYYGDLKVLKAGDTVTKEPVELAVSTTDDDFYMLGCTVGEDLSVFTPYDSNSLENIETRTYLFSEGLRAPIKEGEAIGGVDVFVDGTLRGNATLISATDVEANGFLTLMKNAKKMLVSRAFIIFFITFSVLFSLYFITFELGELRKRKKKIKIDRLY